MNCELYKNCKHSTENCSPYNCGWYQAELSEFQELPKSLRDKKLTTRRNLTIGVDGVVEDLTSYWEEMGR